MFKFPEGRWRLVEQGDANEVMWRNEYRHCGQEWEDVWNSACNDRCPVCNKEIEPYQSEEISGV